MNICKKLLVLALGVTLVLPLAGCDSPEEKAAKFIKRGIALQEEGDFARARIEYKNAIKLQPTTPAPYYYMGLLAEAEGDLRVAFAHFITAEQQDPKYHPAALKIAQYYMGAERYDEARTRIGAALVDNPQNAEAHALLAALLLREKKFDEAEKEAREALAEAPTSVSAYSVLVGIYSNQKQYDKAVQVVNEGIEKNPDNLALLMLRVMLYGNAKNVEKVAEGYKAIFKLKPEALQFRKDFVTYLIKLQQLDGAEAALREGVAELSDNWKMKQLLVLFLAEHRGTEQAEAEIKNLMTAYPEKEEPYFWLADLYIKNQNTEKAINLLNMIVEHGTTKAAELNAQTLLARINIKHGNKDLAEKLVAAVLAKEPDNRAALLVHAGMALERGDSKTAVADLRSIIRNKPKDAEALSLLAETLLLQGHTDLAVDTMKKAVDLGPTNFQARVRLAQIVNANGDTKQAMEQIALVTKAVPDYAIGWEAAARIALDAKDWLPAKGAIEALDKIEGQHLTAVFLEGQLLARTGNVEGAVQKYKEVIDVDATKPLAEHALSALKGAYVQLKQIDKAVDYLASIKEPTPLVSTLLGKGYATLGKKAEAAVAYDKVIKSKVPLSAAYMDRARLFLEEGKRQEAIAVLDLGASVVPGDFKAPLFAASLIGESGEAREAIKRYAALLDRNPELDLAANNMASMIADYQFDDAEALERARQAAERFSGSTDPFLLDTLAWVYYRQDKLSLAQTFMERAMGQKKDFPPQMHYHYGVILLKGGFVEKAREELQKAVVEGADYPGLDHAKKVLGATAP